MAEVSLEKLTSDGLCPKENLHLLIFHLFFSTVYDYGNLHLGVGNMN